MQILESQINNFAFVTFDIIIDLILSGNCHYLNLVTFLLQRRVTILFNTLCQRKNQLEELKSKIVKAVKTNESSRTKTACV